MRMASTLMVTSLTQWKGSNAERELIIPTVDLIVLMRMTEEDVREGVAMYQEHLIGFDGHSVGL